MLGMTKRFGVMALVFMASAFSFATVTVSGNLVSPSTSSVSSRAFVRFWIRGCGGNAPRVTGTGIVLPSFTDFSPTAGAISGTVYDSLTEISCGGSVGATWYGVQAYYDGKPGPEVPYNVTGASFNLNSATPNTTSPVVSAPTGDSTYARLDGGNTPFTGAISVKKLNNIRYADQFTGANAGAKIAACLADLPSTGGTCDARAFEGTQNVTSDPISGVTKPFVLLLGAATYQSTVPIRLGNANNQHIWGLGSRLTIIRAFGAFPSSSSLCLLGAAGGTFSSDWRDIRCDGNSLADYALDIDGAQEQSGARDFFAAYAKVAQIILRDGFAGDGVASTQNVKLTNFEIYGTSATTDGIILTNALAGRIELDTFTLNNSVASSGAAIRAQVSTGGFVQINNGHIEEFAQGIKKEASAPLSVIGLSGHSSVTDLISIDSGKGQYTLVNVQRNSSTTTINDSDFGFTSTDDVRLYTQGSSFNFGNLASRPWRVNATNFSISSTSLSVPLNTVTFGDGAATAGVNITAAASTTAGVNLQANASNRWLFRKNATAESGSNAGSDFEIVARDDSGALLSTPLVITRSTGLVTLAQGVKAGSSGSTISDSRELIQNAHSCGTTTTCANTANGSNRIIFGNVALTSATPSTAVVGSITAFTSTTSYVCTATNKTTAANSVKIVNTSTTSFTITGPNTVTDSIDYICVGN